jgi:hypothetical protein
MMALCMFLYNTLTKDILCPTCINGTSNKGAINFNTASRTKSSKAKTAMPGLNSKSTTKYWSQITLMKRSLSLSCES